MIGMSYCTRNFLYAETRIKAVCEQIKPGMSIEQLQAFGLENGLGLLTYPKQGVNYMVEKNLRGGTDAKFYLKRVSSKRIHTTFQIKFGELLYAQLI